MQDEKCIQENREEKLAFRIMAIINTTQERLSRLMKEFDEKSALMLIERIDSETIKSANFLIDILGTIVNEAVMHEVLSQLNENGGDAVNAAETAVKNLGLDTKVINFDIVIEDE